MLEYGIEGRLQRHLELARHAVVALAALAGHEPDVAGSADLGVERRGVALAADELGIGRRWRRRVAAWAVADGGRRGRGSGRRGGGRSKRGEIVGGIGGRRRRRAPRGSRSAAGRAQRLEPAAQRLERGGEAVGAGLTRAARVRRWPGRRGRRPLRANRAGRGASRAPRPTESAAACPGTWAGRRSRLPASMRRRGRPCEHGRA